MRGFFVSLFEEEIQLARRGIPIHLGIPARLLARIKPLDQALILVWREITDSVLDLLDPIHTQSLAPWPGA